MGILAAYLPTEVEWRKRAPDWARERWSELKDEREAWCKAHDSRVIIDQTVMVSE